MEKVDYILAETSRPVFAENKIMYHKILQAIVIRHTFILFGNIQPYFPISTLETKTKSHCICWNLFLLTAN